MTGRLLETYFRQPVRDEIQRSFDAMKVASALREAAWAMVSAIHPGRARRGLPGASPPTTLRAPRPRWRATSKGTGSLDAPRDLYA